MNPETIFQQAQMVVVSLQALCLDSDAYEAISSHLNDHGRQILSMCKDLENQQNLPTLHKHELLCEHARWVLRKNAEYSSYLAIIYQHFSSRESFDGLLPFIWKPNDDEWTVLYETYVAMYSNIAGGPPENMEFREHVSYILRFLQISLTGEWNVVWKCISEETLTANPSPPTVSPFSWRPHLNSIYAGLLCVEKACFDKFECLQLELLEGSSEGSSEESSEGSLEEWSEESLEEILELIPLVRLMLILHLQIFQLSGNQSASFALKRFPERHEMPRRMWQHGIGPLIDLLRQKLPASYEANLIFQTQAYEVINEFRKAAPAFKYIWMATLGDLARYRMVTLRTSARYGMGTNVDAEYPIWAEKAKEWYSQASAIKPNIGLLHHHLATVSQPHILKQLFHYTKSLLSVDPFSTTEERICSPFDLLHGSETYDQLEREFLAAHEHFFRQCSIQGLQAHVNRYLSQLSRYIGQAGEAFKQQGVYMLLCNFAVILQYGSRTALLRHTFESALPQQEEESAQTGDVSEMILCGSYFAFETFSIILDQFRNEDVYPAVYVSLVFIWCMSCNDTTGYINEAVPWGKIVGFLNKMLCYETNFSVIEGDEIPIVGDRKQMPEEFRIHGYVWSQGYFPNDFFENAMTQDDECSIEEPSMRVSREYRCMWLARKLCKYFKYSREGFALTALAQEHEKATPYDPFSFEDSS